MNRPHGLHHRSLPGRIGFWIACWLLLIVLWLLLVEKLKVPELVAALAAAIGATFSTPVRSQRPYPFRLRARWMLGLWRLPAQAALDLGVLTATLWRHLVLRRPMSGSIRAVAFRATADDAESVARQALASFAGSFSPNTYVLDVDREHGFILLHQLVPEPGNRKGADPLELG